MLGQKKDPARPRRYETPPTQTLEPARREIRPSREKPGDEFFPIPDDLREMFGLPPVEVPVATPVEIEEKKEMPPGELKLERSAAEMYFGSLAAVEEQPKQQRIVQEVQRENHLVSAPSLNLAIDKNDVLQGIIWAEILNNPRVKRIKRYNYKA